MKKIIICIFTIGFISLSLYAEKTFTVVFSRTRINFNPQYTFTSTEAQIYTAVYEGLLSYHPETLEPLPASAQSWEISEDGLTYRFKLRKNLVYNNGDRVIAEHFRNSWLQLMSPENKTEYGSLLDIIKNGKKFREGEVSADMVGIRAESDRILTIELEQKTPYLLKVLCHHSFSPVHPSLLYEQNWKGKEIITNGSYTYKEIDDNYILLERNEKYWDKENVSIKNIEIVFSNDSLENTLSFNKDAIDWLSDSMDLNTLNIPEAVVLNPLFSTTYMFFSNKNEPWSNGNVRKALALLLPWEEIRSSQLIPGSTLIPSIPYYPEAGSIQKQNREEAFKLLKEEGYEKGKGLPPISIKIPVSDSMSFISQLMKENWEEALNVPVSIETERYPLYFESLKKNDYTIGSLTWIGDFADPMTFLQMWLTYSTLNDAAYNNQIFDQKIYDSAKEEFGDRYKIMSEAETILLDSAQVMPLGHSPALNIIDLRFIDGWFPNVLDIHPFKYLKFKTGFLIPGTV